ncbi:MAG: Holliday junction branch migration protein RuvA [Clostridiales bacterium]|nr:Holliday junction branch migration protein RuvA [Clostridiales bacterium]
MIGFLEGKVMYAENGTVLLFTNGVGYEVSCSGAAFASLVNNEVGSVFTYLQVREDGLSLFGFISPEEKDLFLKLVTVSGVGPKLAITILTYLDADDLASAIAAGDLRKLCTVKGLGKKTAERIVLDLQEQLTSVAFPTAAKKDLKKKETSADMDTLLTLTALGFTAQESKEALSAAKEAGMKTPEQLLAFALKHIR